MTLGYRYRKQIIIGVSILLLIGIMIFILIQKNRNMPKKKEQEISFVQKKEAKKETKKTVTEIKIDLKGEVLNPGLYVLTEGERVSDVIAKAGGLTDQADVSVINLSKKLKDEMVIIIYSKKEVKDFKKTKEIEQQSIDMCKQKDPDSLKNDACIDDEVQTNSSIININTATKEQLMTLTGIGERKALDIIQYREANGFFQSIEDIKNVSGIGDSLFAKIKESITI